MAPGYGTKAFRCSRWLPARLWQRLARRQGKGYVHLIVAMADHFEPGVAEDRVQWWCREYPKQIGAFRDSDGFPFRHTYFWPAEQYDRALVQRMAEHCHQGWGELEIHLHHGVAIPDTSANTRRTLSEFRDVLAREHGCLAAREGGSGPQYAFVHGNWALANSAGGRCCGVDDELQILAETGCYADFTLPSAPDISQIAKINAMYECCPPLNRRAAHRNGHNLRVSRYPATFPLIIQGPLMLGIRRHYVPIYIENSAIAARMEATVKRLRLWRRAAIAVEGRSEWIFIKLHCHGMAPRDRDAVLGKPMQQFLKEIAEAAQRDEYRLHFVTAREMVNIALAACAGEQGDPGEYRDYCFHLLSEPEVATIA